MKKILIILGIALLIFVYISENKEVSITEYQHIESVKSDIQKIKIQTKYILVNNDLRVLDSKYIDNLLSIIDLISEDNKVTYKEYEMFNDNISDAVNDQKK